MLSQDEAGRYLAEGLRTLGIEPLSIPTLQQLWRYFAELTKWNRTINLVAEAPAQGILENHFLDSLTLLPVLTGSPLLDVGAGAGFPGLVLKIARPELEVCLVEPRQKRVSFLRHVIRTLKLTGITVVADRLEAGDPEFVLAHGQFPLITCRALTEIAPFLALVEAIAPPGGRVLCMKGPKADGELAAWQQHSPGSPFEVERRLDFTLPFSGATRSLLIFKKGSPHGTGHPA